MSSGHAQVSISTKWLLSNLPKSSAHASGAWCHSHPLVTFLSGIFILTSVNDTSSPLARGHLRSSLHLTNPCTKRKVLSLTKPKGRIYKTKSLGDYITYLSQSLIFSVILPMLVAARSSQMITFFNSKILIRTNQNRENGTRCVKRKDSKRFFMLVRHWCYSGST